MNYCFWDVNWSAFGDGSARVGGQGEVTKVRRNADGALGALKVLHFEHSTNTERRQRMSREVSALSRLEHAGIPRVLEHNMERIMDHATPLFFISEWIEGRTLQQFVGSKPIELERALRITRELAMILGECHSREVVHRDVKPDNILIRSTDNAAVLVDFGTAWAAPAEGEESFVTDLGQELGNRFLRIPDLMAGRERRDSRADLTQLVGVFLFLLTGRAPRVLVDENVRPPHIALADQIPAATINDPRWQRTRSLFDIGFAANCVLRFQDSDTLLRYIDEILAPAPTRSASRTPDALSHLQELMSSAQASEMQRIEQAMLVSSQRLEDSLESMARGAGLQSIHLAGRAYVSEGGRKVEFHYTLTRAGATHPRVGLGHTVELSGDSATVQASYTLRLDLKQVYYEGPFADVNRLDEEMLKQTDGVFADAVAELRKKLALFFE